MQKPVCIFGFCPWHRAGRPTRCADPLILATLQREYPEVFPDVPPSSTGGRMHDILH